jgi:hypothetical protein
MRGPKAAQEKTLPGPPACIENCAPNDAVKACGCNSRSAVISTETVDVSFLRPGAHDASAKNWPSTAGGGQGPRHVPARGGRRTSTPQVAVDVAFPATAPSTEACSGAFRHSSTIPAHRNRRTRTCVFQRRGFLTKHIRRGWKTNLRPKSSSQLLIRSRTPMCDRSHQRRLR